MNEPFIFNHFTRSEITATITPSNSAGFEINGVFSGEVAVLEISDKIAPTISFAEIVKHLKKAVPSKAFVIELIDAAIDIEWTNLFLESTRLYTHYRVPEEFFQPTNPAPHLYFKDLHEFQNWKLGEGCSLLIPNQVTVGATNLETLTCANMPDIPLQRFKTVIEF